MLVRLMNPIKYLEEALPLIIPGLSKNFGVQNLWYSLIECSKQLWISKNIVPNNPPKKYNCMKFFPITIKKNALTPLRFLANA